MARQEAISDFKFGVQKCPWNFKRFIVTCLIRHVGTNGLIHGRVNIETVILETYDQICKFLGIPKRVFRSFARRYNAEVKYNKFIKKFSVTFSTKADARKFIKNWLTGIKALFLLNDILVDVDYIEDHID